MIIILCPLPRHKWCTEQPQSHLPLLPLFQRSISPLLSFPCHNLIPKYHKIHSEMTFFSPIFSFFMKKKMMMIYKWMASFGRAAVGRLCGESFCLPFWHLLPWTHFYPLHFSFFSPSSLLFHNSHYREG